jgi:hypothetical protein
MIYPSLFRILLSELRLSTKQHIVCVTLAESRSKTHILFYGFCIVEILVFRHFFLIASVLSETE